MYHGGNKSDRKNGNTWFCISLCLEIFPKSCQIYAQKLNVTSIWLHKAIFMDCYNKLMFGTILEKSSCNSFLHLGIKPIFFI